ncbi:MAG: regulatory protein RecX [Gammaproteobacteria bacterium]|nr:regulatory protein RecX [Gammaproteobacteria bacterium]
MDVRNTPELDTAIRILTLREHSVYELQNKLIQRNVAPEKIEHILAHLIELNYLSDERFAEAYTAERIRKGEGPLKIRANLLQRRIDRSLAERMIARDELFWLEKAQGVLKRRLRSIRDDPEIFSSEWSKCLRFLEGRGFPSHIARQAMADI